MVKLVFAFISNSKRKCEKIHQNVQDGESLLTLGGDWESCVYPLFLVGSRNFIHCIVKSNFFRCKKESRRNGLILIFQECGSLITFGMIVQGLYSSLCFLLYRWLLAETNLLLSSVRTCAPVADPGFGKLSALGIKNHMSAAVRSASAHIAQYIIVQHYQGTSSVH